MSQEKKVTWEIDYPWIKNNKNVGYSYCSACMVSRGVNSHHEKCPLLCGLLPYGDFKTSPYLFTLSSPINMIIVTMHHT